MTSGNLFAQLQRVKLWDWASKMPYDTSYFQITVGYEMFEWAWSNRSRVANFSPVDTVSSREPTTK